MSVKVKDTLFPISCFNISTCFCFSYHCANFYITIFGSIKLPEFPESLPDVLQSVPGEVAPPGASAGTISFSSRALFILRTSPSINRINSEVLGHIWSGRSYLLPERTCGASSLLQQTSGVSCSSMGSFFSFFFDRPGAAVVPPPRRGAPVQTVIAINPQFEVGFEFANVRVWHACPQGWGGQTIYLQANLHGRDICCLV